jgi:hypothetical protein
LVELLGEPTTGVIMTPLEQYEHDLELYHQAKTLLEARYVDDSVHVALQIEDDKVRFTIMAKITASRKMTESLKDLYISPEAMQQLKDWGKP